MTGASGRDMSGFRLLAIASGFVLLAGCSAASDGAPAGEDPGVSAEELRYDPTSHGITIGYAGGLPQLIDTGIWNDLWSTTSGAPHNRICLAYVPWDVARLHPSNGARAYFQKFHDRARLDRCELAIDFKHWAMGDPGLVDGKVVRPLDYDDARPRGVADFDRAFMEFRREWPDVHVFLPWNEPNNANDSGDGLGKIIPAKEAALYYLAMRRQCHPYLNCQLAAGNFLSFDAASLALECSKNPDQLCTETQIRDNKGSYVDHYKYYLDRYAESRGLPRHFRPEHFAFHPWYGSPCKKPEYPCPTDAIEASLGGSWKRADLWITEYGLGGDAAEIATALGFFFKRPRITRWYYFRFQDMLGAACTESDCPAMTVLRDRLTSVPPPAPGCVVPNGVVQDGLYCGSQLGEANANDTYVCLIEGLLIDKGACATCPGTPCSQ